MKILHVHQGMSIGGVETHMVRLCHGLQQIGHETAVLTGGGRLEGRIEEIGATLIKKTPRLDDLDAIAELVKAENFDIVHGHNYPIAGFSQKLAEAIGGGYLMSVHGPRHPWQLVGFRAWSNPIVVFSEGDARNIQSWGRVDASRVRLTSLCMDSARHRPIDNPQWPIEEERETAPDGPFIVHVSRFANRKGKVGLALLEALPRVRREIGEIVALFVGEGPLQNEIEAKIAALNEAQGKVVARMIGPRTDVEKWMNLGKCVVATATTATEAISCGRPTIAAGRTGFFGLVKSENFEEGLKSCFADHGKPPAALSANRLGDALIQVLKNPGAQNDAAKLGEMVRAKYDEVSMARWHETIYREVLNTPKTSD